MEYLYTRVLGQRVLLADVHRSTDGHGIGYGMLLSRLHRVFLFGHTERAAVFCLPSRSALNTAVTRLESDAIEIVAPDSWRGRALTVLWYASAPVRIGDPRLWVGRTLAAVMLGPVYRVVKKRTWLPRRVRRAFTSHSRFIRALKAVNVAYAGKAEASWQRTYDERVLGPLRALEAAGRPAPSMRLRLPPDREQEARRAAERLGIDPDRPIVTVHVRERGYRSAAGLRQRHWDETRNARIETYVDAFDALVDRGYTVVRLGDPSMTPVSRHGVVDLATSDARTPWLDIWCTMRSEFLIGSDSGPSFLAMLLDVPLLTVNAVHFRDLTRETDRVICKLARDRATGRVLPVSEMLTTEFLRVGFKGDRYECLDNTADDLCRAAIDMIEVVHGREERSSWQNKFNRRLRTLVCEGAVQRSALEGVAIRRAHGTLSRRFAKVHFAAHDARDARERQGTPG